jgi:hypothetical protein
MGGQFAAFKSCRRRGEFSLMLRACHNIIWLVLHGRFVRRRPRRKLRCRGIWGMVGGQWRHFASYRELRQARENVGR